MNNSRNFWPQNDWSLSLDEKNRMIRTHSALGGGVHVLMKWLMPRGIMPLRHDCCCQWGPLHVMQGHQRHPVILSPLPGEHTCPKSHVHVLTKVFFPKPKECRLECRNDTRRHRAEAFHQLWGQTLHILFHLLFLLPQINILFKQTADAQRRRSVHKSSGANQNNGSHSYRWRSFITLVPSPEGTVHFQQHNIGTVSNLHKGFRVCNLKY